MIPPDLPAELKGALDAKLEGLPRSDVAARAAAISRTYREGGGSGTIRSATDALAYALAGFVPTSVLDIGAGPGTATSAVAQAFSSLTSFTLLDANPALRTLALDLLGDNPRFHGLSYDAGDARSALARAETADLVVASYLIGELGDTERTALADAMWGKTRDTLLVVEPGTPAGYARILALRAQLIAAGAHVAAPCPHDQTCPLVPPDWCHFSQRLARSRAHMQMKGAEVPFEDERFSYVVLTREPAARQFSRVLAQPAVGKAEIAAKLCTPDGVTIAKVARRDKTAYAVARHWRWGDAVMEKKLT